MARKQDITDPRYIQSQYKDASKLNARIRLHQEFSTNKYGWQRWLFDQIKLPPQARVLELGCGAGNLWIDNLDRIPTRLEITLSDFSPGMLEQAQHNLSEVRPAFQYKLIDAQFIPFDDNLFDVVIANHMLYHVPDRSKALSEIRRVLHPAGLFYASTIGHRHLKELNDLIARFDPQLDAWGSSPSDGFSLENGSAQLGSYFSLISLYRYPDDLVVTDPAILAEYILSMRFIFTAEQQIRLTDFIGQTIKTGGGRYHISKDSGLFEASGIK